MCGSLRAGTRSIITHRQMNCTLVRMHNGWSLGPTPTWWASASPMPTNRDQQAQSKALADFANWRTIR